MFVHCHRGCSPAECTPGPAVQLSCNGIERSNAGRDGFALGDVLAEQAIRVFIGAALPWGAGMREIHGDTGVHGELPVLGELCSLIPGQGSRNAVGSVVIVAVMAVRAASADRPLGIGTSIVNRVTRSTSVPSAE